MHVLLTKASGITDVVVGAAIEVHKDRGPGLLGSICAWCLTMELRLWGHPVQGQDFRFHALKRTEGASRQVLPGADRD